MPKMMEDGYQWMMMFITMTLLPKYDVMLLHFIETNWFCVIIVLFVYVAWTNKYLIPPRQWISFWKSFFGTHASVTYKFHVSDSGANCHHRSASSALYTNAITDEFVRNYDRCKSDPIGIAHEPTRMEGYNQNKEKPVLLVPGTYIISGSQNKNAILYKLQVSFETKELKNISFAIWSYTISSPVFTCEVISLWVESLSKNYLSNIQTQNATKLFIFSQKTTRRDDNDYNDDEDDDGLDEKMQFDMHELTSLTKRNPETFEFIVSEHKVKFLALLDALNDPNWYYNHGERHKEGFMLYGTPGCGKTKMALAAALYLKRHVILIDWKRIGSVGRFETLLHTTSINYVELSHSNTMFLFEEFTYSPFASQLPIVNNNEMKQNNVDLLGENNHDSDDDDGDAHTNRKRHTKKQKQPLDMDALLSILDGPHRYNGLLFIATSNEEHMDPGLTRDGRLTCLKFRLPNFDELVEFFQLHHCPMSSRDIKDWQHKTKDPSFAAAMTYVKTQRNFTYGCDCD